MHKATTILSAVIVFVLLQDVDAKEKHLFLSAAGGLSYVTLQDRNFSAMPYSGFSWLTSLRLTTETASYLDDLSVFFRDGRMVMDITSGTADQKTTFIAGNIHYTHVRKLNPDQMAKRQFFLGGNFNSSAGFYKRSHYGDNYYYVYKSSIGPAFAFRQPLIANGRLQIDGRAGLSIVSYVICPSYGSSLPENILDRPLSDITAWDYIAGGKILVLNKFQQINCTTNLTYALYKKVSLGLTYDWDFFHLKRGDDLFQAIHNAYVSIIFH